jgi:hypothetical protein
MIKAGLLISDKPLEAMNDDGSDARWVYYSFDEFIKESGLSGEFDGLLDALAECAKPADDDVISRFVVAFEGVVTKSRRSKMIDSLSISISLSGPSIGIKPGQFASIFSSKGNVITNVYR